MNKSLLASFPIGGGGELPENQLHLGDNACVMTIGDCTYSYYPSLPGFETPWVNNGSAEYIGSFEPITIGSDIYTVNSGGNIRVGGLRTYTDIFLQFEDKDGVFHCTTCDLTVNGDITVTADLTEEYYDGKPKVISYGVNPTSDKEQEFIDYFEANLNNTIELIMTFY